MTCFATGKVSSFRNDPEHWSQTEGQRSPLAYLVRKCYEVLLVTKFTPIKSKTVCSSTSHLHPYLQESCAAEKYWTCANTSQLTQSHHSALPFCGEPWSWVASQNGYQWILAAIANGTQARLKDGNFFGAHLSCGRRTCRTRAELSWNVQSSDL